MIDQSLDAYVIELDAGEREDTGDRCGPDPEKWVNAHSQQTLRPCYRQVGRLALAAVVVGALAENGP